MAKAKEIMHTEIKTASSLVCQRCKRSGIGMSNTDISLSVSGKEVIKYQIICFECAKVCVEFVKAPLAVPVEPVEVGVEVEIPIKKPKFRRKKES